MKPWLATAGSLLAFVAFANGQSLRAVLVVLIVIWLLRAIDWMRSGAARTDDDPVAVPTGYGPTDRVIDARFTEVRS